MCPESISRRTAVCASIVAFAAFAAAPRLGRAQGDWLEKGLESLRGFGGGLGDGNGLSEAKIGRGLKEALRVASRTVVDQVGQPGGYLLDKAIHIRLPGFLGNVQSALRAAGAAGLLDDLERRLNRGAEAAAPYAEDIFLDAIAEMTLADARDILDGPDDAATRYFQRTMTADLKTAFRPIVDRELQAAGAVRALDNITRQIGSVPFAPALGANAKGRLIEHGLDGALSGIFHYLAEEEAAIRKNPAKRTTDLLREVFG